MKRSPWDIVLIVFIVIAYAPYEPAGLDFTQVDSSDQLGVGVSVTQFVDKVCRTRPNPSLPIEC